MIAIKSRQVIAVPGEPPIPHGVVLVDGDRIQQVGPAASVRIPPGCTTLDCTSETVLPGLIEAHSHPSFCGANRFKDQLGSIAVQVKHHPLLKYVRMFRNCLDDMRSGITTVRSLGTEDDSDIALRDMIDAGSLPGPRIIASGRPIRPSHGTAAFLGRAADGVEGVRRAVRECIAKGADVIKAFATNVQTGEGDVAYRRGDLTCVPAYTAEELAAICDEAHRAGIKVAAHAIGGPALRWAMEAGADSVEHANLLTAEDVEVFVRTKCVLSDPNLYLFFDSEFGFESRPAWRELPSWWQEKVFEGKERTRIHQAEALRAGVPFALALDSGHGLIWREAKCMVDILGASPQQALRSLTSTTARLCGRDDLGTLAPGQTADLISVAGDPLRDITCLKDVKLIMKEGKRYDGLLSQVAGVEDAAHELASLSDT
jgi:imidazolonepropionase-like amidohydrolase